MSKIIVTDDDGHAYHIDADKHDLFHKLLNDEDGSNLECWERDEWQQFEDCRIDGDPIDYLNLIVIKKNLEIDKLKNLLIKLGDLGWSDKQRKVIDKHFNEEK